MHLETARSHQTLKDGTVRVYQRHLLRRSYREGGKVRKQTLANLSHLPDAAIEAVRLVLAGKTVVDADAGVEVTARSSTGTWPRWPRRPGRWASRRCWARRARSATWRMR